MRLRLPIVLALCLAACSVPAQSPAAPSGSPPPETVSAPHTTIPSDSNLRSRPAWYQSCRERVAAAKGHPVDILFVGDSITESWTSPGWGGVQRGLEIWNRMYALRNALNFGVGADRTEHVLWRLDNMDVADLRPKVAVLLIGTNNTRDAAPEIAAGAHAIVVKLQSMYPGVKIIVVSILPNARASALMTDTNAILRTFADGSAVFYLDLVPLMPPIGDNWTGLGPDHLHPTDAGYQIWAAAMEPLLSRLLGTPAMPVSVPAAAPIVAPAAGAPAAPPQ